MSHYDPPTREERKKAREKKQEREKTVNKIMEQNPTQEIEKYIKNSEGRIKKTEITSFIIEEYIDETWLSDLLDPKWVARDVFDKVKEKSKREARQGWKGMPEDEFIQKKTETWYEVDEVELR